MFCPNCGHKVEGVEKFCTQCGAPLRGAVRVKNGGSSRWPKIIGIVGGVVLIIVVAVLLIGGESHHASPEAVVSSFLTAVYGKWDASQCLELIDPHALEQVKLEARVGMDEIREVLQAELDEVRLELDVPGFSINFEVGATLVQNGEAITVVTLKTSHPEYGDVESAETYATVERDGWWYLHRIGEESIVLWLHAILSAPD